jgi:CheY-like chemotaxis protein
MSAKILVVDDNPTNLKLVSDVLEFEGYDILKAVDAEEAQVVLAATLPDLILMDIALPGMDGLTLTRKLPDQVALFLARASGQSQRSRIKILIIEDSAVDLKLANLVLSTTGHDVSTAEAAEQAFATIREARPQLIFLDLDLPGMDGLAIARKLKGDPDTRAIHIVAVTCYPEQYPKAAALAAGCDAYLLKPINTRKLSDQLNAVAKGSDAVNWQAKERPLEPPHR